MPFSAIPLKNHDPLLPGRKYLFDANAWIFVLEADSRDSTKVKAVPYVELLQQINLAGSPKPKLALPAIILSEVVNRLLRSYYFPLFVKEYPQTLAGKDENRWYKEVYRAHDQFIIHYGSILYNIKAYHNNLDFIDDNFSQMSIKNVLTKPDTTLDFNDFLLVEIAKRNNCILVSDDADLAGRDITIITGNQKIIKWQPAK